MIQSSTRLVVVDWDGTLYDSSFLFDQAIVDTFSSFGTEVNEQLRLMLFRIGVSRPDKLREVARQVGSSLEPQYKICIAHTFLYLERRATLFHGIENLLQSLNGLDIQLAIFTGRNRNRLMGDLKRLGVSDLFDSFICEGECAPKPDPAGLEKILKQLNVPSYHALYVGDAVEDEEAAMKAGVSFVGVRFCKRCPTEPAFASSTTVFDSPTSFAAYLMHLVSNEA